MIKERGRILAVDPGEKNIGLAISDLSQSQARPLEIITHISNIIDVEEISRIASQNDVAVIVIGMPLGSEGEEIRQTRHSKKFAELLQTRVKIPVVCWDESGSTKSAKAHLIEMGISLNKRKGHQDSMAAAMILQSFLDCQMKEEDLNEQNKA